MLNPPTFGVPVTIPEGGLLQRRRWSLYPDRLVRESQEVLWGYSPDQNVMLGDVRLIYVYQRARPLNLFWAVFSIPFFIIAIVILSDHRAADSLMVAVVSSMGFAVILTACVLGFLRRPHVTIQTTRETFAIGMDRPWWSGSRRRLFFNGMAQILGIPDLLAGGGVRRPVARQPGVVGGSDPVMPPPPAPAAGLNAGSLYGGQPPISVPVPPPSPLPDAEAPPQGP